MRMMTTTMTMTETVRLTLKLGQCRLGDCVAFGVTLTKCCKRQERKGTATATNHIQRQRQSHKSVGITVNVSNNINSVLLMSCANCQREREGEGEGVDCKSWPNYLAFKTWPPDLLYKMSTWHAITIRLNGVRAAVSKSQHTRNLHCCHRKLAKRSLTFSRSGLARAQKW